MIRKIFLSHFIGLLVAVAVVSLGCQCHNGSSHLKKTAGEGRSLPFSEVAKGDPLSDDFSQEVFSFVVRGLDEVPGSVKGLKKWQKLSFGDETVLGVAVTAPSGGYEIEIKGVQFNGGQKVEVFWQLHQPAQDAMTITMMSQPFQFIKVKHLSQNIKVVFTRVE